MGSLYYWGGQLAKLRVMRTKGENGQTRLYYKPPTSQATPTVTVCLTKAEAHALNTHSFMVREEQGNDHAS